MVSAVETLQHEDSILISEFNPESPKRPFLEPDSSDLSLLSHRAEAHCLVGQALISEVENIDHDVCDAGDEDSFFVADLGDVQRSYRLWQEKLPMVQAHYAVKCNTDRNVVRLLGHLGANFDCASKQEIDNVLALGFDPSRVVYANPCKANSFIRHARVNNVDLTTIDNVQELYKLKKFHPECRVLVRLITDDKSAQCQMSTKFGCSVETAVNELLPTSKALGINVVGVAFHVGSGAKDFDSIYKAVWDSRAVFDAAETHGFEMNILDIGGGFERETFDKSSAMVRVSLHEFFPDDYTKAKGIRFIAEPGRFIVANAFTLATHVIARRDFGTNAEAMEAMLYINDGLYGNLNCILFDNQHPSAQVLKHAGKIYYHAQEPKSKYLFSIWGPTCDGLDCVLSKVALPANVQVGDWLYFSNLGAYTSAATTTFNGLGGSTRVKYVTSEALDGFVF
ncbi:ornithine decarboxylase [Metschnikowia bicuspidata]|uniref:ornithine decarboxylase n=1 Tax=Metschnikowia bicuspidata TaxID=27322 RepID=A0A4P9ZDQ0_9ASCO|nr:ornithine decarboxylase [Metschnikowia bicuspidata]